MMLKHWLISCTLLAAAPFVMAQDVQVTFRNTNNIGAATINDQNGTGFAVNGLSGITYLGGNDYIAVMDNSNKLVKLTITVNADGSINTAAYNGGITVADTHDFEGITYTNATRNSVFVSEEDTPGVHEYSLTNGAALQTLTTPGVFLSGNTRGNFGFESLSSRPGEMWTANEEALVSDGDRSTLTTGSTVRLLHYTVNGNNATPDKEFAYVTDPINAPFTDTDRSVSRSGVSDLLLLPDGRLLSLERSFADNSFASSFRNEIYEIDPTGATDVSGAAFDSGLTGKTYTAATKHLLWSHSVAAIADPITNLEGITLGPQLGPNRYAAIGVVDDQGGSIVPNRLVSFEIVTPEPASTLVLLAGTAGMMMKRRR